MIEWLIHLLGGFTDEDVKEYKEALREKSADFDRAIDKLDDAIAENKKIKAENEALRKELSELKPAKDMVVKLGGMNVKIYSKESDCPSPYIQLAVGDAPGYVHVDAKKKTSVFIGDMYIQEV